jgi:predicted GNAT superfamily acetyltransferase
VIRDAEKRDFPAILALNEVSVEVLSPMPRERLEQLHRTASLHWVLEEQGKVVGFILAFREGIGHDSVNYLWFAERYPSFLYVDRVVVAPDVRGRGAGSQLYEELFAHARETGAELVTAEFDVDPPNPISAGFHAKFGFHEVGRQVVPYGMKEVSMQIADVRGRGHEGVPPGTVAADLTERRTGAEHD